VIGAHSTPSAAPIGDGPAFFLDADSLLSKWGFGDGDALWEWYWDHYGGEMPWPEDDVLHALCQAYLLPRIVEQGHEAELMRIETIHNPVRLETIDGVKVDHYNQNVPDFDPPIEVWVTLQEMDQLMSKLGYKATSGGDNNRTIWSRTPAPEETP